MANVMNDCLYTKSHEYVRIEGLYAYVGITDYAQQQVGDEVTAEEEFGAVESVKAASDLISPVSGTVEEINEDLEDNPELINEDAFKNWIIKVKLSDKSELDNLLTPEQYQNICK